MGFEKMPGAGKPESEREQAREKPSHNLPAEAERQMAVQEKESQRQELLARVREKIFGNVFGREHSQGKAGDMEPRAFGNISGREHSQGKAIDPSPYRGGNMPRSYLSEEEQERRFTEASDEKAMRNAPRGGGNISGREHSQGKAGDIEPRAFGNMPKSYLPEEEQKRRFEEASAEKAMRNAPRGGGNISGWEHSQGKAGDIEPRAFGNMPKSYLPEEEQKRRFEEASAEKAMRNAPRGGGNISGREHSQGKAIEMEPRDFGNMPKSYLPEEEQRRRFEEASAEKAMRNAPRGGGNISGPVFSEEEIRVEAQKIWDARKGLPGKFKKTQEIGGIKAYDNGNAWTFKVGFDKTLMVSKDHPRLQEIAEKIAQAQQAIDAGDEAAENKFLAQAARLEQGKK